MNDLAHAPVLLAETLTALAIRPDAVYIDATFGRGGHSREICLRLQASGRLFAIDRDRTALNSPAAVQLSRDRRVCLLPGCFGDLLQQPPITDYRGKIAGILLDLGVSSPQLDDPERGFSFRQDGPLDMRMDVSAKVSAADWLKAVSEQELTRVLFAYGEERFARRVARAIVAARAQQPITRTRQLAELVAAALPYREPRKHPATRTFQAIRIEINGELEALRQGLEAALALLAPGGRLAVISFHSLEDRLVKHFFRAKSQAADPGRLPVLERDLPKGTLRVVGKAITPGADEMAMNPRARSARLRVAEKI